MTWTEIRSEAELRALIGTPLPQVRDKARPGLVESDRAWLAASPFCMLATADAEGRLDVSPKGDPAGSLVHVLDEHTIALAERPGNRRADGYLNILANPQVGLDFVIPGRGDTLRINGRGRLIAQAPFLDRMRVRGARPLLALVVEIEEVFHHCAKAFLRSRLWEPETWAPTETVPRRAVLAKQVDHDPRSEQELDDYYGPTYAERLY
ncbi:MSMEG_1061 family FMN-dependent PPOX-type flavoprotein [Nocardioides insulae]|uniref:MSMEG_1061 family FMN-dependent PPOX-type flavoprotein n=1 Tax=Nocardioides insulae TaxID=394734 RepID=UPI000408E4A7|nr:MSMEG_1061 family FMN-dependent PPOX-type flavoprotein [Nocardioides insulae]